MVEQHDGVRRPGMHRSHEEQVPLQVTFWGVRGSVPMPGAANPVAGAAILLASRCGATARLAHLVL